MLYALNSQNVKIRPTTSGQLATCPTCGGTVRAHCGEILVDHWHHSTKDCDPWSESLTRWHLEWQQTLEHYGAEIEVPITKNGKTHRADAVLQDGTVVELQHSAISTTEISEREIFYGNKLVWLFDIQDAYFKDRFDIRYKGEKTTFRWKHPRKSIAYAKKSVYLDLGEGNIFHLFKMYKDSPCGGIGELAHPYDLPWYPEDA